MTQSVLSRHGSNWAVKIMLQDLTLTLSSFGVSVSSCNVLHILKLSKLSPGSWHHTVLVVLLIAHYIVKSRVTDPHQVVQADTRSWLHGGAEDLPSVRPGSKCILHHTSSPVVVDPLIPLKVSVVIWLHLEGPDSKGIIS